MTRPVELKWKNSKDNKTYTSYTERDDEEITDKEMVKSLIEELLNEESSESLSEEDILVTDWNFTDTNNKEWTTPKKSKLLEGAIVEVKLSEALQESPSISQAELDKLSKKQAEDADIDKILNKLSFSKPSNAYHMGCLLQAILDWSDARADTIKAGMEAHLKCIS